MTWTLVWCYSVFLGLCSFAYHAEYPTEEACYKALAAMQQQQKKPVSLWCAPTKR